MCVRMAAASAGRSDALVCAAAGAVVITTTIATIHPVSCVRIFFLLGRGRDSVDTPHDSIAVRLLQNRSIAITRVIVRLLRRLPLAVPDPRYLLVPALAPRRPAPPGASAGRA